MTTDTSRMDTSPSVCEAIAAHLRKFPNSDNADIASDLLRALAAEKRAAKAVVWMMDLAKEIRANAEDHPKETMSRFALLWADQLAARSVTTSPTDADALKVVETLRAMVSLIHAHDIESLSCDRDGEKYCNCLSGKADDAIKVLAAYDAGQEIQAWNNSVAARDRRNTAQPPAASVPETVKSAQEKIAWHQQQAHFLTMQILGSGSVGFTGSSAAQQPDAGDAMDGAK